MLNKTLTLQKNSKKLSDFPSMRSKHSDPADRGADQTYIRSFRHLQ